jgi:hypothetical protein
VREPQNNRLETWTSLKEHGRRTDNSGDDILRSPARYTLYGEEANEDTRIKCIHFEGMYCGIKMDKTFLRINNTRVSSLVQEYTPTGKRNLPRAREKWRQQYP